MTFINKDAEFLFTLGETFIADGDFSTGAQLRRAANNLEHLDSQLQHLLSCGAYAEGVHDAYARIYERSNLPPSERTVAPQMAETLRITQVVPKRIEPPKPKPSKYANLKLELKL